MGRCSRHDWASAQAKLPALPPQRRCGDLYPPARRARAMSVFTARTPIGIGFVVSREQLRRAHMGLARRVLRRWNPGGRTLKLCRRPRGFRPHRRIVRSTRQDAEQAFASSIFRAAVIDEQRRDCAGLPGFQRRRTRRASPMCARRSCHEIRQSDSDRGPSMNTDIARRGGRAGKGRRSATLRRERRQLRLRRRPIVPRTSAHSSAPSQRDSSEGSTENRDAEIFLRDVRSLNRPSGIPTNAYSSGRCPERA